MFESRDESRGFIKAAVFEVVHGGYDKGQLGPDIVMQIPRNRKPLLLEFISVFNFFKRQLKGILAFLFDVPESLLLVQEESGGADHDGQGRKSEDPEIPGFQTELGSGYFILLVQDEVFLFG